MEINKLGNYYPQIRRIVLSLVVLFGANVVYGQRQKSVNDFSWSEAQVKARTEGKYILIDCFTTWCAPCKKMDTDVFLDPEVEDMLNDSFIVVRLQMDKTERDNNVVKSRYEEAKALQDKYKINSFPCILFFNSEAQLVYRSGYLTKPEFIAKAKLALDPSKNLVGIYGLFKQRRLTDDSIKSLAIDLKKAGEKQKANEVAGYYKINYLDQLPEDSILQLEYFKFIVAFPQLVSSNDKFFKLFNTKSKVADSVAKNPNFSKSFIEYTIANEEIHSRTRIDEKPRDIEPQWDVYYANIKTKYGDEMAQLLILPAQLSWYKDKKDWPRAIDLLIKKVGKQNFPKSTIQELETVNRDVYNLIVKNTDNKIYLELGAKWLDEMLKLHPERSHWMDTYASLLYKSGELKDALEWEQKALSIAEKNKDQVSVKLYVETIRKMTSGSPLW